MIFWVDAQLPPGLAAWLREQRGVEAKALREMGLRDAEDMEIFLAARQGGAAEVVVISKDADFVELILRLGAPPKLLWVTCGNVTNARLKQVFERTFSEAVALLQGGEVIVEISG
jgi:predicted nuclease of predicted toxin-antitoxin system